jgi:hypothetical protein
VNQSILYHIIQKRDGYFSLSITILVISFFLIGGGGIFKTFDSQEIGPNNPSCVELGSCTSIWADPLGTMMIPWTQLFGPITFPMIWGIILGIIWLRTHNTLLVGSVGIVIAGFLTVSALNAANPQIWYIGLSLIALSITVVLYQLIFVRQAYPTS